MTIYIPYTYLIGWSKLNWWYYGAEFAKIKKIANPSNLWTTYFTSSKSDSRIGKKIYINAKNERKLFLPGSEKSGFYPTAPETIPLRMLNP